MKVKLYHRSYGVHSFIKETEIPVKFNEIYLGNDNINESLLIEKLPKGFLPCEPSKCLLCVSDEHGGVGQYTKIFRSWGKYFDSYCLDLMEENENA